MDGRDLSTRFAVRAVDFAEAFNAGLGMLGLAPANYTPELMAPVGPSTGGGVQMLQHVRLAPGRKGYPVLVVGAANQRLGTAELRSYEYLDALHRERFGRPLVLDRGDYQDFLNAANNFFEANQLRVTMIEGPLPEELRSAPARPASSTASQVLVMLSGVLIGLLVASAVLYLLMFRRPAPPPPRVIDAASQPAR